MTGLQYYHETASDEYLAVDYTSTAYYRRIGQPQMREARAAAIAGRPSSVCTTAVSVEWLAKHCERVERHEVPYVWRVAITGDGGPDILDDYSSPRGGEAAAELAHRQDAARRLK